MLYWRERKALTERLALVLAAHRGEQGLSERTPERHPVFEISHEKTDQEHQRHPLVF